MAEDELVGWHHRLNGHEFKQIPRDSGGQRRLACCSPLGRRELDMTKHLNSNSNNKSALQPGMTGLNEKLRINARKIC